MDDKLIAAIVANKEDDLKYKKQQIELFFSIHPDETERAEYLRSAYQDRYTEIIVDGVRVGYKPQENGLLMWEGAYLSRTKESVFSWGIMAGMVAQLIEKSEYHINTDIKGLVTQEGQQLTLFDLAGFDEPATPGSAGSPALFSQQVIEPTLTLADTIATVGPFWDTFREVKAQDPNKLVLVKLNGGYFSFENDAAKISEILYVKLSERKPTVSGKAVKVCFLPMEGFDAQHGALADTGVGIVLADRDPDKGISTFTISAAKVRDRDTANTPTEQDRALHEENQAQAMEKARQIINEYCMDEFGEEADFSDPRSVGVAHSTVTDDELEVQVTVDLVDFRLDRRVGGVLVERNQYGSIDELIEKELNWLDFDSLCSFSEEELARAQNDKAVRQTEGERHLSPNERFFLMETDEGYAIWDDLRGEIYVDDESASEEFKSRWQAESYLETVKKSVTDQEQAAQTAVVETVERYLADDEHIAIQRYPNGQYYNRYGYDEQTGDSVSTAGGFATLDEAVKAMYAHRPLAERDPQSLRSEVRDCLDERGYVVSEELLDVGI